MDEQYATQSMSYSKRSTNLDKVKEKVVDETIKVYEREAVAAEKKKQNKYLGCGGAYNHPPPPPPPGAVMY
jgi:hypothetical protein